MAMTEDLSAFFDTDDFAVEATYDGATAVDGVFDNAYLEQAGIVAGLEPVFLCAAASVAADPTGKNLVVSGTTYKIRGIEPQDDGAFVLLRLEKQ